MSKLDNVLEEFRNYNKDKTILEIINLENEINKYMELAKIIKDIKNDKKFVKAMMMDIAIEFVINNKNCIYTLTYYINKVIDEIFNDDNK